MLNSDAACSLSSKTNCTQVDRHRACAGGRVRGGAGVQGKRVEAGVCVAGHDDVQGVAPRHCVLCFSTVIQEPAMKVSDILRVKGSTLYTVIPDQLLADAIRTMAEHDIGSLVVMEHGDLVGMLTFREVIAAVVANAGTVGTKIVRSVMDDAPLTCTPETEIDEVRRMMLGRHARYMPVMDGKTLMGVISFYDVAKAVVDSQDFENRMLKAYIRDWPVEEEGAAEPKL
jgi:CBS domain-containing protein